MELRQEALAFARDWGADYILVRKPGYRVWGRPQDLLPIKSGYNQTVYRTDLLKTELRPLYLSSH
jgi:hypothetical protein